MSILVNANEHAEIAKRDYSEGQRRKLAAQGKALPGGSFPIKTAKDVENAKHDLGRSNDPAAARRLIDRRAKALGVAPVGGKKEPVGKGLAKDLGLTAGGAAVGATLANPAGAGAVTAKVVKPALKMVKSVVGKSAFGVEKSLAADAGKNAKRFKGGFKAGLKRGARGHSPLGQIGSGTAGRPTYSLSGGRRATRAGVHAGIAAANAPVAAAGAAAGVGLAEASDHRKVSKSSFGVELGKALGDDTGVRGGVRSDYTPPKSGPAKVALKLKQSRKSLDTAKAAMVAAATK